MKKIILATVIVFSLTSFEQSMAWDTTAARYLPLRVGNVWVYQGYSQGYPGWQNHYYSREKIAGTVDTLGHRYYIYQFTIAWIVNTNGWACTSVQIPIRIDSTTMNVYSLSGLCSPNGQLIDSLKARIGDRDTLCPGQSYWSQCIDTIPYTVFNQTFSSKRFEGPIGGGGGPSRRYSRDIGMVVYVWAYGQNRCENTLKGCVINGVVRGDTTMIVGLVNIGSEIPEEFSLYQNFPNPFNPVTRIKFDLPSNGRRETADVRMDIYDALGREVTTLVNEMLKPGTYEVEWDGTNFPSGVYFYRLQAGDFSESNKMVLLK